ncbi:MAG: TIGR02269 family lipoprotein, partial [Armatimonadetes bacterium]|nr:TIGR02269 family lipoprotein [Armatimonadota bacterium]
QVAGIGLSLAHSGQSIPELTFLDRFLNRKDPLGLQEHCSVTCTRGRAEIVQMALEEARQTATGSIRATQWWSFASRRFLHHIFPQQLREAFKKIGIDIDHCVMDVPDWFHSWIHSGGKSGGMWNQM